MVAYVEFGFSPDNFWRFTPREVATHIRGAQKRKDAEHNSRVWLAWNVAALSRAKRLPNIKAMMVSDKAPRQRQTWQQQFAIMEQWAAVRRNLARSSPMKRKR